MKKYVLISVLSILTILLSNSCAYNKDGSSCKNQSQKPRNIILMIGDGMSTPQVYAAMLTSEKNTSFEVLTGISPAANILRLDAYKQA